MKIIDLDYLVEDFRKLPKKEQMRLYPIYITFNAPASKITEKEREKGWYFEFDRPYKRRDLLVGYKKEP